MVIRHIQTLIAALLLAPSLNAAEVRLGPEVALAEIASKPSPVNGPLAVASNGNDFLVAWEQGAEPGIVVSRIGRDGSSADPAGRFIAPGTSPLLAGTAGGYLLAWQQSQYIHIQHLDENGAPVGAQQLLFAQLPIALVSKGSTFLLVSSSINAGIRARILDGDGAPLADAAANLNATIGAGVHDGKYVVVTSDQTTLRLHTIADDGSVVDTVLPRSAVGPSPNVAFAPHAMLFSWNNTAMYSVIGYDGSLFDLPTQLPVALLDVTVASLWDGHEFLIVFESGHAFRVAADAKLLDPSAFVFSPRRQRGVRAASNGTALLAVSSELFGASAGGVARLVHDFDALAASQATPTLIAPIRQEQLHVQIARGPRGVFAVWDDAAHYEVRAALNGVSVVIDSSLGDGTFSNDWVGWPAVAAGDHVFLVLWRHAAAGDDRVYFRRYDFDGRAVDPQPIVLDKTANFGGYKDHTFPSIVFGSGVFSVAWSQDSLPPFSTIFTSRIGEQGQPSAGQPVPFPFPQTTVPRAVESLWTGSELVLAYTLAPFNNAPRKLGLAHIGYSNSLLSQSLPDVFDDARIRSMKVAATIVPGRVTFACVDFGNGISMAQTALDGTTARASRVIAQRTSDDIESSPDIAWNGSEYVVTWIDGRDPRLRAMRLGTDLSPIDAVPFDVAFEPIAVSDPMLTVTPTGVLIAYSRIENGTPRAFMRALDRISAPAPRRRSAR
jgi:hypothetical protein